MPNVRIRLDLKLKVQAKAAIDLDQIVKAALQLLDEVGLDGLTMRRLAERLGIRAASLYRHVRDKDELLVLLADEISGEIPVAEIPTVEDGGPGQGRQDRQDRQDRREGQGPLVDPA